MKRHHLKAEGAAVEVSEEMGSTGLGVLVEPVYVELPTSINRRSHICQASSKK
jgi:hypothetical protein